MPIHRFREEEEKNSERLTTDEAREIIAAWSREHGPSRPLSSAPTIADVAEGLGISVESAARLVHDVREQRAAEDERRTEARRQKREEMEARARILEAEARIAEAEARREEAEAHRAYAKAGLYEESYLRQPRGLLLRELPWWIPTLAIAVVSGVLYLLLWLGYFGP